MTVINLEQRRNYLRSNEGILKRNGTIWITSTAGWTGMDRLHADDLGLTEDQIPDIFKLGNKCLISDEWRVKLSSTSSKLSAFMQRVGRPFLGRGIYWIPDGAQGENLMLAIKGFEKIEAEQAAIVQDFLRVYADEQASRIQQYPVLANASWPTPSQIERRFKCRKLVLQGLEGVTAREADPEELIAAKRKFNADLNAAYDEYIAHILQEVREAILDSCEEIATKVLEAGDKVTETTLRKPRAVIQKYMDIGSHFDLDEVKQAVEALQQTIATQEAKTIRNDWQLRQDFAASIRAHAAQIGDLTGINREGRIKRVVKTV